MKHFLFFLFFFPIFVFAQMTSPFLISSSGNTFSNNTLKMEFSIGELVIETHQISQNNILTQGFHQPLTNNLVSSSVINYPSIVYPNPTFNFVTIEFSKKNTGEIFIYNILGKLMKNYKFDEARKKQIDLSGIAEGNYFLHINTDSKKETYKIQKLK